jgi:hypothetical protein
MNTEYVYLWQNNTVLKRVKSIKQIIILKKTPAELLVSIISRKCLVTSIYKQHMILYILQTTNSKFKGPTIWIRQKHKTLHITSKRVHPVLLGV